MRSVMTHQFSQVPKANIPRSSFDRSSGYKTTLEPGLLVPVFVDEALPGDTFNLRMTAFGRLATPIYPIMDNMWLDSFFFAVPYRLVWDNWEKFNGAQDNPGDSTDFTIPQMVSPVGVGYTEGSLEDYFGLPVGVPGVTHSALFHRAYALIWNEWFRDQNLQDRLVISKGDGPDPAPGSPGAITLQRRAKRHDYFTSCLPWPQKGPGVELPLGTEAPIRGIGKVNQSFVAGSTQYYEFDGSRVYPYARIIDAAAGADSQYVIEGTGTTGFPKIYADLTEATAATINSLRQAFQVQKLFERDARGGTRYIELIKSHFQVTSPDFRFQRPEYLGGGSSMVNISPIAQTSGTPADTGYTDTPLGNLAAMGTVLASGHGFTHSFTEHCLIIGMVCVRADLNYQQGLERMWSRKTRFDFYWPALNAIGEQAVLQKEIYCTGVQADDDKVFGYNERHAEYRYKPSKITGKLRSSSVASLDAWHLAQDFATAPLLNSDFIQENPPIDRVIAVPTEPAFILDCFHKLRCARPMPLYGVPGLIDHF